MTLKRTIKIEVEMSSDASEAALNDHLESFLNEVESHVKAMRFNSWHQYISNSWDESQRVHINTTVEKLQ